MARRLLVAALTVVAAVVAPACKKTGIARVGALREALAEGRADDLEALGEDTPPCTEDPPPAGTPPAVPAPCLATLAKSFGGSAYVEDPPDQASAGAVAISIVRDGRADRAGHPDAWIQSVARGKGAGADAIRLAVARAMKGPLEQLSGLPPSSEDKSRGLMRAVAAALPGACVTYARLGAGAKNEDLPLAMSAEHSPCVNRDLGRPEGPGPTYGHGVPRAAEGALALWKDYLGALAGGVAAMDPRAKKRLEAELPKLQELTAGFALEKVAPPAGNAWAMQAGADHADAGLPGPPSADAGAPDARAKR
jgi:hypothetical protein